MCTTDMLGTNLLLHCLHVLEQRLPITAVLGSALLRCGSLCDSHGVMLTTCSGV